MTKHSELMLPYLHKVVSLLQIEVLPEQVDKIAKFDDFLFESINFSRSFNKTCVSENTCFPDCASTKS